MLLAPGNQFHRVKACRVLGYWAAHEFGMLVKEVGLKLGLSQSPPEGRFSVGKSPLDLTYHFR